MRDAALPSETFSGFWEATGLRLLMAFVYLLVDLRRFKSWLLSMLRINRAPRVPFGFAELMAVSFMMSTEDEDERARRARTMKRRPPTPQSEDLPDATARA